MPEDGQLIDSTARDAIARILLDRQARMIAALEESGHPPVLASRACDFDVDTDRMLITERSFIEQKSALALDCIRHYFECFVLDFTFPDEAELSATNEIIRLLGKNFHQPWYHISPDEDTEPAVELFQTLLWPLSDYFISLTPSADDADRMAKTIAAETLDALSTGSGSIIERVALNGVAVKNPVSSGRITFRPLTMRERSNIAGNFHRGSQYDVQLIGTNRSSYLSCSCVLEARTLWNITEVPPDSLFWADRTVLALQLLGVVVGGPGWVHTSTNPRNTGLDTLRPLPLFPRAPVKLLDTASIEHAANLAEQIPEGAVTEPKSRRKIALNRFLRGCATVNPADALLEHTIALEAILLPAKFEGELNYRLRVNAAWLLGSDTDSRVQIARTLSRIYALRSTLVHGLKPPQQNDVQEAASSAREILRNLLCHCLEVNWPSESDLLHLAFGPSHDAPA